MAKDFLSGYDTYDDSKGRGNPRKWRRAFFERMTDSEAEAILANQELSPWDILGVPRNATTTEIKKAFRALIAKWHPDRCSDPNAEEMSKKIIAAYTKMTGGE
jgi:DnaJ-domain-containing protein 1